MATVVFVEVTPDLIDNLIDDSVALDVTGQNSCEGFLLLEVCVREKDLDVCWEALPKDGAFVRERLTIDDADLFVDSAGRGSLFGSGL